MSTIESPKQRDMRNRRAREVRARTVDVRKLTRVVLAVERALYPEAQRRSLPLYRYECEEAPRPCPYVTCAHHLYLDASRKNGSIKLNFPDVDIEDMDQLEHTCALDVAALGGLKLEEVGAVMNMTRERVRQIQQEAIEKLTPNQLAVLREFLRR